MQISLNMGKQNISYFSESFFLKPFLVFVARNPMPDREPVEFKPKDSVQYNYFDITNEGIVAKPNLYKSQMDFWDEIVGLNQTYDKNNFV